MQAPRSPMDSCLEVQFELASHVHCLMCLRPKVTKEEGTPCVTSYGHHSTPYTWSQSDGWGDVSVPIKYLITSRQVSHVLWTVRTRHPFQLHT